MSEIDTSTLGTVVYGQMLASLKVAKNIQAANFRCRVSVLGTINRCCLIASVGFHIVSFRSEERGGRMLLPFLAGTHGFLP